MNGTTLIEQSLEGITLTDTWGETEQEASFLFGDAEGQTHLGILRLAPRDGVHHSIAFVSAELPSNEQAEVLKQTPLTIDTLAQCSDNEWLCLMDFTEEAGEWAADVSFIHAQTARFWFK